MATGVVDAEMERLERRLPGLDAGDPRRGRAAPCAGSPTSCCTSRPSGSRSWPTRPARSPTPTALAELFALDPEAVDAVTRPRGRATMSRDPDPARHPRARCSPRTQSALVADRAARGARPRGRARRGDHRGRPVAPRRWPRSAAPASSSARCATRCCAATSTSPCTPSRTCPPAAPSGIALAAVPLREDPRDVVVARDGLTLGELPAGRAGRHRLAAPGRAAARARPRFGDRRRSAATWTPGSARSVDGRATTRSCSPAPGWPGSAGSTR